MRVEFLETLGSWQNVKNSARTTVGKDKDECDPSPEWKRKILLAEHSPIRQISIRAVWTGLKSWVSVHFVRHKFGIEHFVQSQRTDRTGIPRDELPQGSLVNHEILVNQQAIIYISRKRLCNLASLETRMAWRDFLKSIEKDHPELVSVCVSDCVYRGWCYEMKSCGYVRTESYQKQLNRYRENINGWTHGTHF